MTKTEYAEYLASDHWQEKRQEVLAVHDECVRCSMPRWLVEIAYGQDLHIHHKTYANLGSEALEDLESLCARCHEIETFGRSAIRAPKESRCEYCGQPHWNCRSALCELCLHLFVGGLEKWVRILERVLSVPGEEARVVGLVKRG